MKAYAGTTNRRVDVQSNGRVRSISRATLTIAPPTLKVDAPIATAPVATPMAAPAVTVGKILADGSVLYSAAVLAFQTFQQAQAWKPSKPLTQPAVALPSSTAPSPPAQAPTLPTQPASTVPAATSTAAPAVSGIDWAARRRKRVVEEIMEAAVRSSRQGVRKGYRPMLSKKAVGAEQQGYDAKSIEAGLQQLETLLPGFQLNLDALPAQTWAKLALDIDGVAARLVALKAAWPGADLSAMLTVHPKALTSTPEHITQEGAKVRELIKTANNPCALVQAIPELLSAQSAASILVTVNKWYDFKRDPVEVLETDPELVSRAQAMEIPFEPVYLDADNNWVIPGAVKINKPDWAKQVEEMGKKQGQERQAQLKKQHIAASSTREGAGTTAFMAKSFEEIDPIGLQQLQ